MMGVISKFFFGNGDQDPNKKIQAMQKKHTYSGVTNQWYDKKSGRITSMDDFTKMSVEEIEKECEG